MNLTKQPTSRIIIRAIAEFFSYALIAAIPFVTVYIDLFYLKNIVGEQSVVEYTQDVFLASIIMLFAYNAVRFEQFRAGFVLLAGFVLCMLIRELDNVFDQLFHGSWVYFASTTAGICIIYALTHLKSAFDGLYYFISSRDYGAFLVGLIIVLVTSRLLGMGYIWKYVLGEGYVRTVKHIIEECSELFGYSFMLFSLIRFTRKAT